MTRFRLFAICVGLLLSIDAASCLGKRPNVIVILTDDQGWGDLSWNGNSNLSTPHIDSLARDGARLDRFFVCPVCSPTRAEFLTGRYHPRGGVYSTSTGGERLDLDERTIAQLFKASGYATAAFGKWHNGMQYPYHPLARGFNEFYGYCSGHWGDYFSPQLEHNGELVVGDGYLVDDFTNRAMDFVASNANRPYFLYLALPTPHAPMQVPDQFWNRMKDRPLAATARDGDKEDSDFTRAALAMVESIDANIGRLLNKLRELQQDEDTIVVFFCDNGPNSYRYNGGMKGKKGSTDEGGVRSPLFIRWPSRIRPGRLVTQIAGAIDLLPTLCDLADIASSPTKPLDGVSLTPLLLGKTAALPERMLFSHWNGRVSVRTQHFRLDHRGKLFDMLADPGQTTDVTSSRPQIADQLRGAADRWKADLLSGLGEKRRPFTVGHPDFALTQLPARDAVATGGIVRSASAPNCSFYTNWSAADDKISWDIDVLHEGRFEVTMYHTCAETDVGAEIRLQHGEHSVTTKVQAAHSPVAVGPEHDRVIRKTQSPMKDFAPMRLGVIQLDRGRGDLVLSAEHAETEMQLEMRLLMLRRVQ
ncbi:MAG: arylsulfatase [Aureliella sp.]